ncbi:hypothetical protein E2C01_002179 [Portunus trituberculatus]|uniref:Uncharacterized protein n=1 Tax=Portunus trituberculatus TaxID=210409 RepID=A0A5B7CLI1_PORTR|nr:hypothetical protein [Portunus trituberculatus]
MMGTPPNTAALGSARALQKRRVWKYIHDAHTHTHPRRTLMAFRCSAAPHFLTSSCTARLNVRSEGDNAVRSRHSQHTQFNLHFTPISMIVIPHLEAKLSRPSVNIYQLKFNRRKLEGDIDNSTSLYDAGTVGDEVATVVVVEVVEVMAVMRGEDRK